MNNAIGKFMEQFNGELSKRRDGARALSHYNVVEDKHDVYCYTKSPKVSQNDLGEEGFLGIQFKISPTIIPKTNSSKLANIAIAAFNMYEAEN